MKSNFILSGILKNSATWHVIFILVILYCVSSINVLLLAIGVLRFLPNAYLNAPVLRYFAEISFGFACFLGIYHLSTIFRRKKRRQDKTEEKKAINIKNIWQRSRILAKIITIAIVLHVFFSVYTLLWTLGILPKIIQVEDNIFFIIYSIASFALTTLIAGFHMATLILRQKRASDLLIQKQRSSDS